MSSTLLIGYGGFGSLCVREYSSSNSWPAVIIDDHDSNPGNDNIFLDSMSLTYDINLDKGRLHNLLEGHRNVLLVSSLGGESFEYAYTSICDCAEDMGVEIITLCTLPFSFESERRSRAVQNLDLMKGRVRNMFVIDSQKTIREDSTVEDFLGKTKSTIIWSIGVLKSLLDCGPFYTYCADPLYTIALSSNRIYADGVREALGEPLYDIESVDGKILFSSSSEINDSEMADIVSLLSRRSGALPEYLGIYGGNDQEVTLFIPIFCRQHE